MILIILVTCNVYYLYSFLQNLCNKTCTKICLLLYTFVYTDSQSRKIL